MHLPVFDLQMKVLDVSPLESSRKYLLGLEVNRDALEDGSGVCPEEVVTVLGVHRDGVEPADAEMLQLQPSRVFMQSPGGRRTNKVRG